MRTFFTALSLPTLGALALVYHIPTFVGGRAFGAAHSRVNKYIITSIFFLCAVLFNLHAVGSAAALYTTLWILPVIALYMHQTLFTRAFVSTWLTHAVGSVITLYTHNTLTAAQWIGIMPLALVERTIFTFAIMLCAYSIMLITKPVRTKALIIHSAA